MRNILVSFLFIVLSIGVLEAQNGAVRGNVYEKESGEPIIYGTVQIQGTKHAVMTDLDGFFMIPNVPAGDYKLVASYVGYDSSVVDIKIKPDGIAYQAMYLAESGVALSEVNISAEREHARTTVNISQIAVSQRQIKALPSVGGEPDIVQYLQVIPGIISTGDQGGQIYIRGGSPIQNKILLDGLTFCPFHSWFFSVFEMI
ncbi:MAG: TonB-dependent receptor [Chitinophagales bacterium]|nr:TonB-dependent receptor [Chitinophagales bacterium]